MGEGIVEERMKLVRHSAVELSEHWFLAISGFLLIFSGFGELPMYKRFMVTQIPGLAWAGDFFINLKIHYLAGIAFVSVMVFHAIYHGWLGHQGLLPKKGDMKASILTLLSLFGFGEEPKSHKYLPEQRLAYAYLGLIGLILVLTGFVKVYKNQAGVFIPPAWVTAMTLTHTFGTIFFLLGVLAHLAALIFKVNRPLVKSIFTGKVDQGYVQDRHAIWYEELMKEKVKAKGEAKVKPEESDRAVAAVEIEEIQRVTEGNTMSSTIRIKGMSCQHCVMSVTKALSQLDGIKNVQVDLAKGEVRFDNVKEVALQRIEKAISEAGYEVIPS